MFIEVHRMTDDGEQGRPYVLNADDIQVVRIGVTGLATIRLRGKDADLNVYDSYEDIKNRLTTRAAP